MEMSILKKVKLLCIYNIYMAIISIPIISLMVNGKQLPSVMSELSNYFLGLAMLFWGIKKLIKYEKIYIPRDGSIKIFILFICALLLSGIANIDVIYQSRYMDVNGFERFTSRFFLFCFFLIIYVCIYDIFMRNKARIIAALPICIFVSFIIAVIYSFFEIGGGFLQIGWMRDAMFMVDQFIHPQPFVFRLRSICLEPSMFGIYASLVLPWLLYLVKHPKSYVKFTCLFLIFCLFVMVMLTLSRQTYVIFFFEFMILAYIYRSLFYKYKCYLICIFLFILFMSGIFENYMTTTSASYNLDIFSVINTLFALDNESNLARYGGQVAGINAFFDNPLFGVGFGQYAFRYDEFLPSWALKSEEIVATLMGVGRMPMTHSLYAILLAETGILGLSCWLALWLNIIIKLYDRYKIFKLTNSPNEMLFVSNLIVSIGVLLFNWSSWESMTIFVIWLLLALSSMILNGGNAYEK